MEFLSSNLKERLGEIQYKIDKAAKKSGRSLKDIKLVGVTKNVDVEKMKKGFDLGITQFGESKVQELLNKYEQISKIDWHFIGRLQTNKVKYILDKVCIIHSIDKISLAEEIDRLAKKKNLITNVLVQVNISGEDTKAGVNPSFCEEFLLTLSKFENINVKGLMTIAPISNNKDEIRRIFANLNKLFIDMTRKKIHNINMEYLSAGMTNDFEIAIEEGANIVRIGSGIFGERY